MNKLNPEVALRRIESFTKRFGKAHLYLAYHAAFPLALTPDLLYNIWANFQQDIHGQVLGIPWIAVADLLLSSICDEVGYELYEIDLVVRDRLLKQLQSDESFGKQRINQLSDFLLEYVQNQLHSPDPDIQDFAKTQQWIALAYTQPTQAARELALAFSKLDRLESAELLRMASLTETFTEPLSDFQPLLIYARGMENFALGDVEAATAVFGEFLGKRNQIQVSEIILPIPKEIIQAIQSPDKATNSEKTSTIIGRSRRHLYQNQTYNNYYIKRFFRLLSVQALKGSIVGVVIGLSLIVISHRIHDFFNFQGDYTQPARYAELICAIFVGIYSSLFCRHLIRQKSTKVFLGVLVFIVTLFVMPSIRQFFLSISEAFFDRNTADIISYSISYAIICVLSGSVIETIAEMRQRKQINEGRRKKEEERSPVR